jgi:hypothetical protein
LEAVSALIGSEIAILGGDVLKIEHGRPRYTYDNWYVNQWEGEPFPDYLRRSWGTAERYIRDYPDPQNGTILYALVIAELGIPGSAYATP